ncbi:MAG TPA: hypothetical protein PL009_00750 [Flavipsychrobacter sp.]|nr:hypothetical protein [Flavipsychrobacter sp.]
MNKNLRFTGTVHFHNTGENVACNLPLILFEEDNNTICYCPALDLSGYGSNEVEAQKSFEITLGEYFSYTINKKTLKTDLSRLGWQFKKNWKKKMVPPDISLSLEFVFRKE